MNHITIYIDGPILNDSFNIEHSRFYVTSDILCRILSHYFGYYVFTIMKHGKTSENWKVIKALGVRDPDALELAHAGSYIDVHIGMRTDSQYAQSFELRVGRAS
jgi:hypothetical protein